MFKSVFGFLKRNWATIVRGILAVVMCYWVYLGSFTATALCLFAIFAGMEIELFTYKKMFGGYQRMVSMVNALDKTAAILLKEMKDETE